MRSVADQRHGLCTRGGRRVAPTSARPPSPTLVLAARKRRAVFTNLNGDRGRPPPHQTASVALPATDSTAIAVDGPAHQSGGRQSKEKTPPTPQRLGPTRPAPAPSARVLCPQHVGAPRAVVSHDRPIRGRGAPSTERARRCFGDAVTGREGPPPRGAPQPPHARALRCVVCGTTGPQGAAGLAPHPLLTRRAAAGQQKTRPERGAPLRAGDLDLDFLAQRVPPPGKGVRAHPDPRPTLVRADVPVKLSLQDRRGGATSTDHKGHRRSGFGHVMRIWSFNPVCRLWTPHPSQPHARLLLNGDE